MIAEILLHILYISLLFVGYVFVLDLIEVIKDFWYVITHRKAKTIFDQETM